MPRRKKSEEGIMDITRMAEDLGVSKTTVSRALSGNGRVSEATSPYSVCWSTTRSTASSWPARWSVTP